MSYTIGKHFFIDAPAEAKWQYFTEKLKNKWPAPFDANGEEVVIIGNHFFYAVAEVQSVSCPSIEFKIDTKYLIPKLAAFSCNCDVFVTGCICGYFEEETKNG